MIRLTNAPATASGRYSYSYEFRWVGFDPDGQVDHFLYAVDPPAPTAARPDPDTAWVKTTANGGTFTFSASDPDSVVAGRPATSSQYHVFVVKAVDDKGLTSAPAISAFNAQTLSPTVNILFPTPSSRTRQYVAPSLTIRWSGNDPDGVTSHSPIYYRIKLLTPNSEVPTAVAITSPDSVRRYYQPRGWAGWDSVGPNVTQKQFLNLIPLQEYAFCVVAFDEAGAYTPYFSMDANMLYFRAIFAAVGGPQLTLYNDFFTYTYTQGVWRPFDPNLEIHLQVPANTVIPFHWSGTPYPGAPIVGYRWVMDPVDITDNTPRTDERTDVTHWSAQALANTEAEVGPFPTGGDHRFYVEATDLNGLKGLGQVHFQVILPAFSHDLLVVKDTRMLLDRRLPGSATCISQPLGRWPTAAELDTFLFARGGVPIRCYPAGSYSRPGLFTGYSLDTVGTRIGAPLNAPSLSLLARYSHVLWLTDGDAALLSGQPSDLVSGMTAMRNMNQLGQFNPLAAYIHMGGEVWLAGGGAVTASLLARGTALTLAPGRFAYDLMHWRSTMRPLTGSIQLSRSLGRLTDNPGVYAGFPTQLASKSLAAGDSMPAWRTSPGDFYFTTVDIETITSPDTIIEDFDPTYLGVDRRSTLDTLYRAVGTTVPPGNSVMTIYHGLENERVIVTGFDIWNYERVELRQLVDTVLQGLWGLHPSPMPAAAAARSGAAGPRPGAGSPMPVRLSASPASVPTPARTPAPWRPGR